METSKSEFNYEFDVPYVDFNDPDDEDEGLDEWFDVNHYEEDEPMQTATGDPPVAEQPPSDASVIKAEPHSSEEGGTLEDNSNLKSQREQRVVEVKKEPESCEEDATTITKGQQVSGEQDSQGHGGQVKEEPMSTESESTATDTDNAETNQHHEQEERSTEEISTETVAMETDQQHHQGHADSTEEESTDTETNPRHGEEHSGTASTSENDGSVQSTVTPRKRRLTPHKMIRRSMRKSNVVTSWSHRRKKPVGASSGRTRRSNPLPVMNTNLKTSEQLELERIEAAKKELERTRQMSQQSLKMVRASHSYKPTHSMQPPTRPHSFQFKTDNRLKTAKELERAAELEKERLAKKKARAKRRPVIKAPLLATSRTRRMGSGAPAGPKKAVKSFALQMKEFQEKTPDRFHSRPAHLQNKGPMPAPTRIPKQGVTIPMSPALRSKTRKRPVTVLSAVEREEQELEEIKKYKFKATPVDSAMLGPSRSDTSMRSTSSKESREDEAEKFEFHARPVPSKILEGVTGVSKPKSLPITCPKSPAFALKNRIRPKEPEPPKEDGADKIKARPIPFLGIPFKPTLEHKTTNPDPFSFEGRDRETVIKKEEKIKEIHKQEQEARIFHAQPAPDLTEPVSLPEKKVKPPTKMAPFHVDHDSASRAEKWAEEVQKDLEEQKKRSSSFKARPPTVLYQEPFKPERPTKPLTDISDFTLNTEKRAAEREEFERYKYEVQMKKMAEMEQQRRLEEEEERREVERLRQEAVHKAQPVHHFKGVKVQPSDKPLTVAESPKLATDRRSKMVDQ